MIQSILIYLDTVGLFGFLYALKGKITNSTTLFKLTRAGYKHPLLLRVPSSDASVYQQIFISQEYNFGVKVHPKIIVDAGANIGLASVYFANKYPDATIIAIEPEQSNFALLKKNVAPYPNIIPVQAALWDKNEVINLIDPGLGKWGFMTTSKNSPDNTCHAVTAMTVSKIIEDFNLPQIDILKIDIEGAEKEVFSDTSLWIEKVDSLIVELHDRMKSGCARSFYYGSPGFDTEWTQGENVYLSKGNLLSKA